MIRLIGASFVPVKVPFATNQALAERYEARFTPTIVVLSPDGKAHESSTGYLPPDEYAAFVSLGRGKALYDARRHDEAIGVLRNVPNRWPKTAAAPEALYWLAVASYEKTQNPGELEEVWKVLRERYADSVWAKKVSFLFEAKGRR